MVKVYKISLEGGWNPRQVEAFLSEVGCPSDGIGYRRDRRPEEGPIDEITVMPKNGELDPAVVSKYPVKSIKSSTR